MFKILQHNDLIKRGPDRLKRFIQMIENESLFLTIHGEVTINKIQLINNSNVHIFRLYDIMYVSKFKTTFICKLNGNDIEVKYPNEFYKTEEFGGKGLGFGTKAEDYYLEDFKYKIDKVLYDSRVEYINLNIGNRIIKMSGIISTPMQGITRAPKSDFTVIDNVGNHTGWISHKAGNKPSHFQQYGGLSHTSFNGIPEVGNFVSSVKSKFPMGLSKGVGVYRYADDNLVIMKSIYGVDFGLDRGINNVDEFHQGYINIKSYGYIHRLESNHSGRNGDNLTGGYRPIYYARYTSDRGAKVSGEFIPNARVGIFPLAKAPSTTLEI